MKYIMFEADLTADQKVRIPIIFPNSLVHKVIASHIRMALCNHFGDMPRIVSAGECIIEAHTVAGESETLKLKSAPGDMEIINSNDYMHGLI